MPVRVHADNRRRSTAQAIWERTSASPRTSRALASGPVPGDYIAGQESALVNLLNGGQANPTFTPPMVFQQGVRQRPTLVTNAETLAHVALIARHGAQWFRGLGTPSQPGSALVTLAGAVAHRGFTRSSTALPGLADRGRGGPGPPAAARTAARRVRRRLGRRRLLAAYRSQTNTSPRTRPRSARRRVPAVRRCLSGRRDRARHPLACESERRPVRTLRNGLSAIATSVEEIADGVAPADAPAHRPARGARSPSRRLRPSRRSRPVCDERTRRVRRELADHARHGPCDGCAHPVSCHCRPPGGSRSGAVPAKRRSTGATVPVR